MTQSTQPEPMSAAQWLREQPEALQPDCRTLLLEHLNWRFTDWVLQRERPLREEQLSALEHDRQRLQAGEPLAYVLGTAPFRDLLLTVSPAVLIPRPETELIVELALCCLHRLTAQRKEAPAPLRIVDVGTGSGAIILGLASALRRQPPQAPVTLYGCDHSPAAIAIARSNGQRAKLSVHWAESNWLDALPGTFALLLANPPYLAAEDPALAALQPEPREALVAGSSGLEALASLAACSTSRLTTPGAILLEHGADQGYRCRELLRDSGLVAVRTHEDQYGHERFTEGWRSA